MKNSKTVIGLVLLVAILLVAVGYAAITAVELNISGTATANASAANGNFVVRFTGETAVSDETKVTAAVTDDLAATIAVTGLTAKGDQATATYTIANESKDLSADLLAVTSNLNTEYFTVSTDVETTKTLKKGTETTITVTVELIKTPIDTNPTGTIGVAITADPVQPQ